MVTDVDGEPVHGQQEDKQDNAGRGGEDAELFLGRLVQLKIWIGMVV